MMMAFQSEDERNQAIADHDAAMALSKQKPRTVILALDDQSDEIERILSAHAIRERVKAAGRAA